MHFSLFGNVMNFYVLLDGVPYGIHYCLPGQQPAAAWWAEQLTEDLKKSGLVPDAACPAAFGPLTEQNL